VRKGASSGLREGDFGFSKENGEPAAGHDIELVNLQPGRVSVFALEQSRFAFNCKQSDQFHDPDGTPRCKEDYDQAFVETARASGHQPPNTAMFGPDGALYLSITARVRDFRPERPRARSSIARRKTARPGARAADTTARSSRSRQTGVIWRISRDTTQGGGGGDDGKATREIKGDKD